MSQKRVWLSSKIKLHIFRFWTLHSG